MSYFIKNGELIAATKEELKSGAIVRASYQTVDERIDAARDLNLVNAQTYTISNAKKWEKEQCKNPDPVYAYAINGSDDEFRLV